MHKLQPGKSLCSCWHLNTCASMSPLKKGARERVFRGEKTNNTVGNTALYRKQQDWRSTLFSRFMPAALGTDGCQQIIQGTFSANVGHHVSFFILRLHCLRARKQRHLATISFSSIDKLIAGCIHESFCVLFQGSEICCGLQILLQM